MNGYIFNKNTFLSFISASLALTVPSVLGALVGIKEAALGFGTGILLFLFCMGYKEEFNTNFSKKFFLTKVGYIVSGIAIGLILLGAIFNMAYIDEGGWIDFTDFIFVLIGYPLLKFLRFNFDNAIISSRLILYAIVFFNLLIITYLSYIIAFVLQKILTRWYD